MRQLRRPDLRGARWQETANNQQGREGLLLAVVPRLGAGEGRRKTVGSSAGALRHESSREPGDGSVPDRIAKLLLNKSRSSTNAIPSWHRCRRNVHRLRRLRSSQPADRGLEESVDAARSDRRHHDGADSALAARDEIGSICGSAPRSPPTRCSSARARWSRYLTTRGFRDVPFIQRGNRASPLRHQLGEAEAAGQAPQCFEVERADRASTAP